MSLTIHNKPIGPISFGLMGFTTREDKVPFDDAVQVMKAALENGSNIWNGGEFYGPADANSLQLLNHYFTTYPEDKEKVLICIKGAFSFHPVMGPDNSAAGVRKSIDTCLELLEGKVFLDIWEPARADPKVEIEETIGAVAEYVKAGKVGGIGLSECSANTIRRAHKIHSITSMEVELSIFTTDPLTNGIAETCAELGITLFAYAPLSQGFLTGQIKSFDDLPEKDWRRMCPRFQPDVFDENMKLVNEVKRIAENKGCTAAQVAIGWVSGLNNRPGMPRIVPLPGATTIARVEENLKVVTLDAKEMKLIDDIIAKMPVQGHRWPAMLQAFADK